MSLTPHQRDEVVRRLKSGERRIVLAREFGCHTSAISLIAKRCGCCSKTVANVADRYGVDIPGRNKVRREVVVRRAAERARVLRAMTINDTEEFLARAVAAECDMPWERRQARGIA